MCYLPFEVFSVSFSNKSAAIKFIMSITIAICMKNKLKLYFLHIITELVE